jgi:hypothetical protein
MPGKSNNGKRKKMKEIIILKMVVAVAVTRSIMVEEDAEGAEKVAAKEATPIVSI